MNYLYSYSILFEKSLKFKLSNSIVHKLYIRNKRSTFILRKETKSFVKTYFQCSKNKIKEFLIEKEIVQLFEKYSFGNFVHFCHFSTDCKFNFLHIV